MGDYFNVNVDANAVDSEKRAISTRFNVDTLKQGMRVVEGGRALVSSSYFGFNNVVQTSQTKSCELRGNIFMNGLEGTTEFIVSLGAEFVNPSRITITGMKEDCNELAVEAKISDVVDNNKQVYISSNKFVTENGVVSTQFDLSVLSKTAFTKGKTYVIRISCQQKAGVKCPGSGASYWIGWFKIKA